MKKVSDEFYRSFMGGGALISEQCSCGRTHFCNPQISQGDFEDGEYDNLLKLQKEDPENYIESEYGSVSYFYIGNEIVVYDCPCGKDISYEKFFWNYRYSIMEFYKNKLEKIEREYWEFSDMVHSVDFKSDEKYTYEEFINKFREKKLKTILNES